MVSFEVALSMICARIERDRLKSEKSRGICLPSVLSSLMPSASKLTVDPLPLDSVSDVELISKVLSFS